MTVSRGVVAAVIVLLASMAGCEDEEPIPHIGALPSFELVDQSGAPFRSEDMRGKVWVANFVFTSCPTICPALSRRMMELQGRFEGQKAALGLVSFSVDPENDTPEVLREYAARHEADPSMWTWVTGPTERVSDTVVNGFRLAMGEPTPVGAGEQYEIMHSAHFVLIDRRGNIRGYYASDDEGTAKLVQDVERLIEEGT